MKLLHLLIISSGILLVSANAKTQTCISLFEEQKIISKLSRDQQDTLMSLAQHQVDVTNNHLMPQMHKIQILQQIESDIFNFMRDMQFNTYETKLFLTEYRALVFKAKEKLNPNIDLQIAKVENKQNAIKEAKSKIEKIELIKKKYWELEKFDFNHDIRKMTLDLPLWSISKIDKLTKEHIDDFKLILEFGGNPFVSILGSGTFFIVLINNHNRLIELIIDNGIDVNAPAAINHEQQVKTALMAVKFGSLDTVRLFLEKGANSNILDPFVETALKFACTEGRLEIVKLLIEHKADINSFILSSSARSTALHVAAESGHLDIVKLLVQSGANTKARNALGKTPLQHALDNNQTAIADFLEAHAKSVPLSEKIKDKLIDIKNYFKGERK